MKLLTASALLCAMMVLTAAAGEWYILNKPPSCPCGWTEYYDQRFFYVSEALAWVDAQRKCESMNANLASVHSLEEYQLLQRVIFDATKASERTWIGGFDGQRGYWFWIDGTRFQYTNWCKSEPNNHSDNETNSHLSALRESDDS
ncbi:hypothetical protein ACER0C_001677 [Sarotherodon galilaeus]